jgi:hypothetical protein
MNKGVKLSFRVSETEYNYLDALKLKFKQPSLAETIRWIIHQNIRLTELLEERRELIRIIDRLTREKK